jgi:uncharacterized membrane protein
MNEGIRSEENWGEFISDMSTNVGGTERVVSSVAGGALLAYGLKHGGVAGTLMALLGGGMLLRGTTGHCHVYDAVGVNTSDDVPEGTRKSPFNRSLLSGRVHVTKSVVIDKSASELYQFWRNFENLPIFMRHLEAVTNTGDRTSHWKAKAPLGTSVEWDAELTSDVENERIGWKSLEGSDIANSGVVEFRPTSNRGTIVKVTMIYEAPGGKLGQYLAKLFGEEPEVQAAEDLRRFKSLMEVGFILKTEGQTSGRESMPARSKSAKA